MPKRDDLGQKLKELIAESPLPNVQRTHIAKGLMARMLPAERENALREAWAEFDETLDVLKAAREFKSTAPGGVGRDIVDVQAALKALMVDIDWLLMVLP
jgi:hypothetical protein